MNRTIVLLTASLLLLSCQDIDQNQEAQTAAENAPEISGGKEGIPCNTDVMVMNSDPFTCLNYDDSLVFYYDAFTVICESHPDMNGYVITINDTEEKPLVNIGTEEGSSFFVGIFKHYAFIDDGTGQIRGLSVIDLDQNLTILEENYVGDLKIEQDALKFEKQVDLSDPELLPECPEELRDMEYGIGYVEEHTFNFTTRITKGSGNYRCQYFE